MDDKTILSVMDKFNASSISELELSMDKVRLTLRKAGTAPAETGLRLGLPVNAPSGGEEGELITSPIVATFYDAPGPGEKPFAGPGTRVKAGDTLCILEAMKMMNHLEAEFDCEVLEVTAKGGDLVEYGQALFRVKRA
jgi:acetyl-CoA carboxylase biotin carboxyl carrier protein